LFAAIEGTALHTRVILDRMAGFGTPIRRVINGGGIPQRNDGLNRVYANALNKPVLVPAGDVTSVGSAIFAFLAAGEFQTVEEAQDAMCSKYRTVLPEPAEAAAYEQLFEIFQPLYFSLGKPDSPAVQVSRALPSLRRLAGQARQRSESHSGQVRQAAN
jgi:L-ribulokinase